MDILYDCLAEVGLERYYDAFLNNGISNAGSLLKLLPRDYGTFGLSSSEDRHRLYELINILRSIFNSTPSNALPPTSPQRYKTEHKRSRSFCDNIKRKPASSPQLSAASLPSPPPSTPVHSNTNHSTPAHISPKSFESSLNVAASHYLATAVARKLFVKTDLQPPKVFNQSHIYSESSNGSAQNSIEKIIHMPYNSEIPKTNRKSHGQVNNSRSIRDEKIKVCVRKRPLCRKDDVDVVEVKDGNTVIINEMKLAVDLSSYVSQHRFYFDIAFGQDSSNEEVYDKVGRPLIEWLFENGQSTVFTYGQTGAGKTFTMMGSQDTPGLYLLAARDIFTAINRGTYGFGLHMWLSYYEIYCGQLFDLLNRRKRLSAREDGAQKVCIIGLTQKEVPNICSLIQILDAGVLCRSKGSTSANPDSSRSHAVLQLQVRDGYNTPVGRISFIDLAGNERAADVKGSSKQSRKEGAAINQSLLALKECIRSLDQESGFTSFRQSKLTRILKDSFIGKSKTYMIANITPSQSSTECTLNTLRYANRVKEIRPDAICPKAAKKRSVETKEQGKSPHSLSCSNIECCLSPSRVKLTDFSSIECPPQTSHDSPISFDSNESTRLGQSNSPKARSSYNIPPDRITIPKWVSLQDNAAMVDTLQKKPSSEVGFKNPPEENSKEAELLSCEFNCGLNDLNKSRECKFSSPAKSNEHERKKVFPEDSKRNKDVTPVFNPPNVFSMSIEAHNYSDTCISASRRKSSVANKLKKRFSTEGLHCSFMDNSNDCVDSNNWFGNSSQVGEGGSCVHSSVTLQEETKVSSITREETIFPFPPTLIRNHCDNESVIMVKNEGCFKQNKDFVKNPMKFSNVSEKIKYFIDCGKEPALVKKKSFISSQNIFCDIADPGFQRSSSDTRNINPGNSLMNHDKVSPAITSASITKPPTMDVDSTCIFDGPAVCSTPIVKAENGKSCQTEESLPYKFGPRDGELAADYLLRIETATVRAGKSKSKVKNIDGCENEKITTAPPDESMKYLCNQKETVVKPSSEPLLTQTLQDDSSSHKDGSVEDVSDKVCDIQCSLSPQKQGKSDASLVSRNTPCHNVVFSKSNPSTPTAMCSVTEKKPHLACLSNNYPPTPSKSNNTSSNPALYPEPPLSSSSPVSRIGYEDFPFEEIRDHFLVCHEKQLATMTTLCKQEMKLLLQVKANQKEACYGNRGTSYRQDPYQCGRYYLCEGFNAIQTKFCPSHQTWSDRRQRCVLNTAWPDSCILRPDRVTIPSVTTSTPSFRGSTQHRKSWPPLTQAPHIEGDRKEERWRGTQSPSNSSSEYDWLECNAVVTSPYIVGGLPASDGQWPWQVLLKGKLNSTHTTQCGGVLIGTKWIVTAAHCVYRPSLQHAAAWTVTLGEHTINTSSGREKVITPSNIIRHEDYSPTGGFANDIALIELPQHLDLNPRSVFPICIASSAGHLHIDPDRCWITGWGNTEGTGDSNVLQTLKVHMWSQHRCKAIWTGLTGDGHICITSENSGACLGDSGGPLSCKVNDKFVLAGIASWGVTTCRNSHFPDVYTNVSFYTDWIRRHVTSHNN
ncbi:kinesin-like protein KIN-7M, chloroplastic [Argonauta hians]